MLFSIVTSDLGSKILSSIVDIINPVLNDLTVHANYINLPDHFSGKKIMRVLMVHLKNFLV